MADKKYVRIDYLARVEGEAALQVELGDGQPAIQLKIFEPPRFFEGFLVGRKYNEVGDIVSRICGICPVSHMTTTIQAIEKAMGIKVSEQTLTLRRLLCISQNAASHLIHIYMLAMPDYYGYSGFPAMLTHFGKEAERFLKIKEALNGLTSLIGGRALHPITHLPGGFTRIPDNDEFQLIRKRLEEIREDAREVVKDAARLEIPDFTVESEYMALDAPDVYAVNEGRIKSSAGLDISMDELPGYIQESQVDYAFAKQTQIKNHGPVMVGALARLHIKFDKLLPETRALAAETGFRLPCPNPFRNILSQSFEIFDGILRCIEMIKSREFREEKSRVIPKAGEGGSLTEAPRGLLFHWYRVNGKGIVEKADIVTPTAFNFLNIERDLRELVHANRSKSRDEIRLLCEELIRAYDPCFSCSVH